MTLTFTVPHTSISDVLDVPDHAPSPATRPGARRMRPADYPCPECHAEPRGVLDTLVVIWSTDAEGYAICWEGNDPNSQESYYQNGQPVLCCPRGHAYTHPGFSYAQLEF